MHVNRQPGELITVQSREVESFIRCPMRSYIAKRDKIISDLKAELHKSLDSVFTYTLVKASIGINPSLTDMNTFFNQRFIYENEEVREVYLQEGLKVIKAFHENFDTFKSKFEFVHPPFEMEYSNYGVFIKILVNAIVKNKTSGLPVTRYLFFDYNKTINNSWNSNSRLWASVCKNLLVQQGISAIEVGCLHILSGKMMIPKVNLQNSVPESINSIALSIANKSTNPVYTGTCSKCLVQTQCATEISF